MSYRVAIAGASGYVGGELLRLLSQHPEVRLGALTGQTHAGQRLGSVHRNLGQLGEQPLLQTSANNLHGHDVVFLALPHGHSARLAAALSPTTVVLDCGADHRLTDPQAWKTWYGGEYAGSWPYGMPELAGARSLLKGQRRIAVPGCYPTAVSIGFAPLLAAGLVHPEVVIVAASGTSGAGRSAKPELTSAEVMGSMSAYGVGGPHRHTPEIAQNLSAASTAPVRVSFTPLLAPMSRGIMATISAPATKAATTSTVRAALIDAYRSEPFVQVLADGVWPHTAATLGSNNVHIQAVVDERAQRVVVVAALDNLTKGAAGQAVQCMNLAVGLPETLGVPTVAVAP